MFNPCSDPDDRFTPRPVLARYVLSVTRGCYPGLKKFCPFFIVYVHVSCPLAFPMHHELMVDIIYIWGLIRIFSFNYVVWYTVCLVI